MVLPFFFKDLPNNMIHQVAIKSLPQEWLWCETWCDDASKKSAKTIDLVSVTIHLINERQVQMILINFVYQNYILFKF